MLVFLDFEASSLSKRSYPIEVGWVFEDGQAEAYLIRPAPDWTDWDGEAEAIHHIARERLLEEGTPHDVVATHMVEALDGRDLLASAPSWDGKWLSALLRAAGLPRHRLRLRDSDDAMRETAESILRPVLPPDRLAASVGDIIAEVEALVRVNTPAHRALEDARAERAQWLAVRDAATRMVKNMVQARRE
ncbi:3'-5' exonuclease [Sphingobium sp. HWE2-09]|uniref:3'-5' exonuclease n=1 Tax=Sphingobium sp. HWE2-09 TaxID=3108390 RepID=UPI002DC325CF|nr:transcriptional regulator [Sphingobium sp. HWE2-09]